MREPDADTIEFVGEIQAHAKACLVDALADGLGLPEAKALVLGMMSEALNDELTVLDREDPYAAERVGSLARRAVEAVLDGDGPITHFYLTKGDE